jgi:hypothetical protein
MKRPQNTITQRQQGGRPEGTAICIFSVDDYSWYNIPQHIDR